MFYDDGFDEEVEKKLAEYEAKFPDGFPLMEFEGNKKQLIRTIDKCIKQNKEFYIKYKDDEDD